MLGLNKGILGLSTIGIVETTYSAFGNVSFEFIMVEKGGDRYDSQKTGGAKDS